MQIKAVDMPKIREVDMQIKAVDMPKIREVNLKCNPKDVTPKLKEVKFMK